jgi:2'-5' RNA ligase
VIWVGLGGDIHSLLAIQSRLEEKLTAVGFPREKRSFKAHLTLGRIKQAANPAIIRQVINEYANLSSDDLIFKQIILYKSDLKPSGAVYSQLKQARLGISNVD